MGKSTYTTKYYKDLANDPTVPTVYEFYDEEKRWLGYIDGKGKVRQAINLILASTNFGMTYEEYLLDMLEKKQLCGYAEETANTLKRELVPGMREHE